MFNSNKHKKPKFFILAIILIISNEINAQTSFNPTGLQDGRGVNSASYVINRLQAINRTLELSTLNTENTLSWSLFRQTFDTFASNGQNEPIRTRIYDIFNPSLRENQTIRNQFICLPNDSKCNRISVPNFDTRTIGLYRTQSRDNNDLIETVDYNVAGYLPLNIDCANQSICIYNSTTQSLTVLANNTVRLSCSVLIAQNDLYEMPGELVLSSEFYGEECRGNTTITQLSESEILQTFNGINQQNKVILYKLTKSCSRLFSKQEVNKVYTCSLMPTNQTGPSRLTITRSYENLPIKLDVQYGPEYLVSSSQSSFNKTLIVGSSNLATFSCPFSGYPEPNYYWRVASVSINNQTARMDKTERRVLTKTEDFSLSSREYTIPSNLQVGTYVFECKAQVLGIIQQYSPRVTFYLTVLHDQQLNIGAIVGGTVGGFVLLCIVTLLVVFLIRRRNSNPKDASEKPKEIDIDITDNSNPHINSKSNLNGNKLGNSIMNGGGSGHKIIAGLMVQSSTAQSYAAIAHAAAAAAQSNLHRNTYLTNSSNNMESNSSSNTQSSSSANILNNSSSDHHHSNNLFNNSNSNLLLNNNKAQQSYNNPGFFESTTYPISNHLGSPPPYDAVSQQPIIKKDSPNHHHHHHQQQQQQQPQQQNLIQNHSDQFQQQQSMKLIPGLNTPTQPKHSMMTSQSYSASHHNNNLSLLTNTGGSMQHIQQYQQYQQQQNLQYTTVQSLENRARSRNPLNSGLSNDIDQQQQTQYSTMAQLSSNPIDV